MSEYEFWKMAWEEGWADDLQLKEAITLREITQQQYKEIVVSLK